MKRALVFGVAVMTLMALLSLPCARAEEKAKRKYGKIELLRDKWGVPHVFAESDAGAMYGLGYATAEDRAFQMYYNLRIIQGRLAELVGDVKVGVTRRLPQGKKSALRNDLKMRTIGYFRGAERAAASLDKETAGLLEAYSAGVNDYVTGHRKDLLYLFDKLGLEPEPWTPAACVASWWRMGLFFAGDGLREMGAYYQIKSGARQLRVIDEETFRNNPKLDDAASVIQRGDVDDAWAEKVRAYAKERGLERKAFVGLPLQRRPGPKFSHAWVVGGKKSADGSAVLVSDPQTPVRNPSLFYEYHLSGKTFNVRGIGPAGSPAILIGFSKDVAWGLTALGADQADLFLLKTDDAHPDQYEFDGKWRKMDVRQETILIKGGKPRTIQVRETRFGPVVTSLAMGIRKGDEVALKRIPLCETDRETIQGNLAMWRARDAQEFKKALAGWRFPSANCVFGDRAGNIGYMTVLASPVRSRHALNGAMAAHEGWSSRADWQEMLPADLLPQVMNPAQGWIVSANHRPIASFYPINLGNATGGMGDTDRSWRLKERITSLDSFKPQDVLDIHYDMVSPAKRDLVLLGYHLRDVQKMQLDPESLLALKYLETWRAAGCKSDMSIPGTEVMNIIPLAFRQNFRAAVTYGGGVSGLCHMLKTINERLKKNPKANLTEDEAEWIDLMLRGTWRYGKSRYGGEDTSKWHERGKKALTDSKLAYQSTLDGFPSLDPEKDVAYPPLDCIELGTIRSQRGQSYTQYVPLSNADKALTILPVGQSERPDSPYHLGSFDLWAEGDLRPAPLSRKAVDPLIVSRKDF